jgi:N-dimethylarginine dimethylaminohydrolase
LRQAQRMIQLSIKNEFSSLEAVVLGTAKSNGGEPSYEEAYDPKSKEHIKAGTFPLEKDMVPEMEAFAEVLERYGVKVYRPKVIQDYNQIFTRDIAFVIDETFVITQMLEERSNEIDAIQEYINQMPENSVVRMSGAAYVEGGDVMPVDEHLFVGYAEEEDFENFTSARTNPAGLEFLRTQFPKRNVIGFELNKSDFDPRKNALHLDCCFQPLGLGHVILHPEGFKNEEDVVFIQQYFGDENCFIIDAEEMYQMCSNVFSIRPDVVVTENGFTRLNNWLKEQGYTVEPIPYSEISKMEGLLRCSTLPLRRNDLPK